MSRGQIFLDTQRISSRSGHVAQRFYSAQKHPDPVQKSRIDLVGALLNHNDFVTVR